MSWISFEWHFIFLRKVTNLGNYKGSHRDLGRFLFIQVLLPVAVNWCRGAPVPSADWTQICVKFIEEMSGLLNCNTSMCAEYVDATHHLKRKFLLIRLTRACLSRRLLRKILLMLKYSELASQPYLNHQWLKGKAFVPDHSTQELVSALKFERRQVYRKPNIFLPGRTGMDWNCIAFLSGSNCWLQKTLPGCSSGVYEVSISSE